MSQLNHNEKQLSDDHCIQRCIELAKIAFDNGNTPVGSIVVLGDTIIAEGIETLPTSSDVTGHAELIAVQKAVYESKNGSLHGTTLYSTAEPCFMCSYVIRNAEISRVVFCLDTPLIGGVTSDYPILTDSRLNNWKPSPQIERGILAQRFTTTKEKWQAV